MRDYLDLKERLLDWDGRVDVEDFDTFASNTSYEELQSAIYQSEDEYGALKGCTIAPDASIEEKKLIIRGFLRDWVAEMVLGEKDNITDCDYIKDQVCNVFDMWFLTEYLNE